MFSSQLHNVHTVISYGSAQLPIPYRTIGLTSTCSRSRSINRFFLRSSWRHLPLSLSYYPRGTLWFGIDEVLFDISKKYHLPVFYSLHCYNECSNVTKHLTIHSHAYTYRAHWHSNDGAIGTSAHPFSSNAHAT